MPDHDCDDWMDAAAETVEAWRTWTFADTNAQMRKARIRFEASIAALETLLDPDGEQAHEARAQAMEP